MKATVAVAAAVAAIAGQGTAVAATAGHVRHARHHLELGSNVLSVHATAPVVRADTCWPCVQPNQGSWHWAYDDALARKLKDRWQPVLDYSPVWAAVSPGTYVPPQPRPPTSPFAAPSAPPHAAPRQAPPVRIAAFARYAAAFVKRYRPRVIEIWNEPDIVQFWDGHNQPAAYARLFVEAYRAIKRVDPQTLVLAGGLDEGNGSWFIPALAPQLDGIKPDGWSVHPYAASVAGMQELLRMDVRLLRQHHLMAPFYVTEYGCMAVTGCLPGPAFKRAALADLKRDHYVVQADWWGDLVF